MVDVDEEVEVVEVDEVEVVGAVDDVVVGVGAFWACTFSSIPRPAELPTGGTIKANVPFDSADPFINPI